MSYNTGASYGSGADTVAQAVIQMEGSMLPGSVNMTMVQKFGLWNVGHLIWAGQYGAVPVVVSPGGRQWAGWPSQADAYAGLVRDLMAKARQGLTIRQAFEKYAPPSENNTELYIAHISAATGYPSSTPLASVMAASPGVPAPEPGNVYTPPTEVPVEIEAETEEAGLFSSTSPDSTLLTIALGLAAAVALSVIAKR